MQKLYYITLQACTKFNDPRLFSSYFITHVIYDYCKTRNYLK